MIKKENFIFFLLFFCSLQAQETTWTISTSQSYITYSGKHTLHDWEGTNEKLYGRAILNQDSKDFNKLAILVNVRDFDSKNPGRDAHSLEVLEALQFPEIKFYADSFEHINNTLQINGAFEFHGKKLTKSLMSAIEVEEDEITLEGRFNIIPTDFGISLPAFMLVKMKNLLEINYEIVFTKESGSK
ncbi:MAG: polyisoprenoid-binding protein YceI [Flavobacteriaceae bacterium]|jgi:polyisoprenoid-binding protein YceI|tara:strand:- start:392 stop:949 length:558 start_codon:yes stop_codon:yes gene_type:complete